MLRLLLFCGTWLLLCQAAAARTDIPCGGVEAGAIHVDGLVSDWEGVEALTLAGSPVPAQGKPLAVRLRCNHDDKAVYLLIEVQDDIVVRTPAAGPAEDHVELALLLGGKIERLSIHPGVYAQKIPRSLRWQSGSGPRVPRVIEGEGPAGRQRPLRGPPAIEVYDALLPQGYAVELRLPLALLPGHGAAQALPLGVRVVDGDSKAHPQVAAVADTGSGPLPEDLARVQFAEAESALGQLLDDIKASRGDIWWERTGDIGGGPGRILMVGRHLCVISREYGWQEAAPSQRDVREVQLVSVGEGQQAVALRVSESGGGGSREVLRLYRLLRGQFQVIFAAEVGKQKGASQLQTQVAYVRRGRAVDIVLTPRPAVGFTAESWEELPASDVLPILLPWQDRRTRYVLGQDGRYVKAP